MTVRHKALWLTIAALGTACLPAAAQTCEDQDDQDDRTSELGIVHVRPDSTIEAFLVDLALERPEIGVTVLEQIPSRSIYLLAFDIPGGTDEDEMEVELNEDFSQTLVTGEFLYAAEAPEGKTGSTWVDGLARQDYDDQYALGLVGAPAAHQRSTGRGTVVAVLDTGVDATHPALAGRVLPNGYDFIDDDNDPADVGDGINNDPLSDDDIDELTGHGTFVAGIVAMIAPEAKILPVRVLDSDGGGSGWVLTKGLYYAIDHGVEVINLSVGTTHATGTIRQATLEAAARGIVVVAAAGNFNCREVRELPAMDHIHSEEESGTYPVLDLVGAFGVSATDPSDAKAAFSNYHEDIVVSAPGAHDAPLDPALAIVSTLPDNTYGTWEGTSFATPVVAGTIALLRAQYPDWRPADWRPEDYASGGWIPDFQIYDLMYALITETAFDLYPLNASSYGGGDCPSPGNEDCLLGAGRIDTAAAVGIGPVAPPFGDLDADGAVRFNDLLRLLSDWGRVHSSADLDGDGMVGFGDVLEMLANWS